jgi:hypothetical protein
MHFSYKLRSSANRHEWIEADGFLIENYHIIPGFYLQYDFPEGTPDLSGRAYYYTGPLPHEYGVPLPGSRREASRFDGIGFFPMRAFAYPTK